MKKPRPLVTLLPIHRLRPLRAVGAALLLAAAVAPAGCNDRDAAGGAADPQAAAPTATPTAKPSATSTPPVATAAPQAPVEPPPATVGSAPQITFETPHHDFGVIVDTQTYRTSYRFRNTGSSRLEISDVKAACGCTVPTLAKREYEPGEQGTIEVVFNPRGKQGHTEKRITVVSNSQPEGVTYLTLSSEIKPLITYDRMQNLGTIALGEGARHMVNFYYEDPDLQFKRVTTNNDHVSARIVESGVVDSTQDGTVIYRAVMEVTVDESTPWGIIYATRVEMLVNGKPTPEAAPVDYDYSMFILGSVYGEIHSDTGIVSLSNMTVQQPFEGSVMVSRPSGRPFSVTSAVVTDTPFDDVHVRVEPRGQNAYRIVLYGNPGRYRGAVRGTITLGTDVEGEESLLLRFAGQVQ